MISFGKGLGLETLQDEVGNVLIRKPATPGMEGRKTVTLQSHLDMVPQKNSSVKHDFEKDPIDAYIDGDWVTARETTLGADNGMGAALAMAVLADNSLRHGPIEALFTIDEEQGMDGSFVIPAFCHGKRVGLSKLMLKRLVCAHVIGIYGGVICAKQPKQKRRYYAGAVFTSCAMEQNRSPFGINSAYYSAYAYGGVFGKNYAAVYLPHPFARALLTAVVTGKYIVHLVFKSTFALGEFPAPAFRNLNMNIVRAGKSGIGMKTAFIFAAHIENRAELTKSRSIADTPQCA